MLSRRLTFLIHTIRYSFKNDYIPDKISRLNADFAKTGTIRIKTARNLLRAIEDGMGCLTDKHRRSIAAMQETLTTMSTARYNDEPQNSLDTLLTTFANQLQAFMEKNSSLIKEDYQTIKFFPSPSSTTLRSSISTKVASQKRSSSYDAKHPSRNQRTDRTSSLTNTVECVAIALDIAIAAIDPSETPTAGIGNFTRREARRR